MKRRASPPNLDCAHKTVERVIRDTDSLADIVSRIRALFGQSMEARGRATLDSLIADVRDLMAGEAARRRVRLDVEVEDDLSPVVLDPVQIQQVLVSLVRNAMDAMDLGMGSAICRSIVASHAGRLWAQNIEPQGALFVFALPLEVKAAP